jgi:hypothetical protein
MTEKGSDASRSETAQEQFEFHRTVAGRVTWILPRAVAFAPFGDACEEAEGARMTGLLAAILLVGRRSV